jgi:hypothetical protein
MERVFLRTAADFFRRGTHALGKQPAETFSFYNLPQKCFDCFLVSPRKIEAVGFVF